MQKTILTLETTAVSQQTRHGQDHVGFSNAQTRLKLWKVIS